MVVHEPHAPPLANDDEIQRLYNWVDGIPLSRPKRNISRDFADGVMMAETVAHFVPKLVELHNYSQANALTQKLYNWNTLNQKVFRRMGFLLHTDDVEDCARVGRELHSRGFVNGLAPGFTRFDRKSVGADSAPTGRSIE
ncbi:sperm flagellar 1 [Perkinsus olseni]|uniref:Sperm flagellar 1 n=1 Tax=Perkinsus olseni TaxID=32597 RepID=A0A7J6SE74_PEROL|nr:sperm flagellar 1 [Perkinsus olseni]